MTIGTIKVDFAGTYAEARVFAAQNGVNASRRLASAGNEGLPMLSIMFTSVAQREQGQELFHRLGWDKDGEQIVHNYDA